MSAEVNPAVLGHVAQTRSEATPANALLEGQAILTIVKDVRQICLRVSFIYITEKLRQYGTSIVHLRMTQWDIFSSFFSVMHLQFYILARISNSQSNIK